MRNVHEFDRKINMNLPQKEIKEEIFESFLKRKLSNIAMMMATQIIQPNEKNDDHINQADARFLLFELLSKIQSQPEKDQEDMYKLLEEQLEDMLRLGPCPQGRTIRLWQLLQCF